MSGFKKLLASAWYSSVVRILKPIDTQSITNAFWAGRTGIQSSFFQHSKDKSYCILSWTDLKFLVKQFIGIIL